MALLTQDVHGYKSVQQTVAMSFAWNSSCMLICSSGYNFKTVTFVGCFDKVRKTLYCRLVTFEEDGLKICLGWKERYGRENQCRSCSLLLNIHQSDDELKYQELTANNCHDLISCNLVALYADTNFGLNFRWRQRG